MKRLRLISLMLIAIMGISGCNFGKPNVPEGVEVVPKPTYVIGSEVILKANHAPGMQGAKAKIVAAYDTTAYSVTYTPTTGEPPVKNYKWIIQEEIKNHIKQPYDPGTEVILKADHVKGMLDATGKLDTVESTTVYMVDYTPTSGGGEVKNYKWVTESELSPVK
ncbi:YdhK family protein [Brevibacillus sp. HB2.2]|uniref:YdhK family protein n=1 Tax=Brevibacillus sp. HB2.2 TaxID=2738846 RepID=UPI00156BAAE7|nr:YdhK family protein [Brevibacillus sp. HB2.2]NRS46512.1 YdhK family protein [Brevibacillus sp. HB2.2]